MNTTTHLILSGTGYAIAIAPDAMALKRGLLEETAAIVGVASHAESEAARNVAAKIAKVRTAVEKCRKDIKAPVLEVGKRIDDTAKEFMAELDADEKRLTGLIGDYAKAVEAERRAAAIKQAEAEREQYRLKMLEEARIKQAKLDAELAAQEAAAAIKAAEAALWDGDGNESAANLVAAEHASLRAAEAAEAANAAGAESLNKPEPLVAAIIAPPPPKGVTYHLDFEVTNLSQLYQAAPSLCVITACRSAILAALKQQRDMGHAIGFPGLRVVEVAKVNLR